MKKKQKHWGPYSKEECEMVDHHSPMDYSFGVSSDVENKQKQLGVWGIDDWGEFTWGHPYGQGQ